jgi:hypothetical protein
MSIPTRQKRRRARVCTLAAVAVAGVLAPASAVQARVAHAAKISAKGTCAKLSAGSIGAAVGVPVKRASVRDNLAIEVGDRSLGFECGFYPLHSSEKYPSSEQVVLVNFSRSRGTTAKLKHLLHAYPHYPGYTLTPLKGVGSVAFLAIQPFGEGSAAPELPEVTVYVLKGHTIFYAFSKEVAQPAVEKLAKTVASKI